MEKPILLNIIKYKSLAHGKGKYINYIFFLDYYISNNNIFY